MRRQKTIPRKYSVMAMLLVIALPLIIWYYTRPSSTAELVHQAEQGDPKAQYKLAFLYERGTGVPRNPRQAYSWFLKAAEQGYVEAQLVVSEYDLSGEGGTKAPQKAIAWLNRAIKTGSPKAKYRLGHVYLGDFKGNTLPVNYSKAFPLIFQAAKQGYVPAQTTLSYLYYYGYGAKQNYALAYHWNQLAASKGDSLAMSNLAEMYLRGFGTKQDYSQALYWYQKAASDGNPVARANLGYMYAHGLGVSKDLKAAKYQYGLILTQIDPDFLFIIADSFETGQSTPKDKIEAKVWMQMAASQGHAEAKARLANLDKTLNAQEKEQAQTRLAELYSEAGFQFPHNH